MPFGRYKGKTFPQIIVLDLDWFFWMLPKLYGKLGTEAHDLARKVRAIRIPKAHRRDCEVASISLTSTTGFAALHSSRPRVGVGNGRQDFHTSTWRGRFVARNITNEQAAS
jgi:hypothetical protein